MKPMSFDFKSRRSMIVANRGMVAASNPLAAQAGLDILRKGGNAVDAAIATAAVLNVTAPASTGIGGDCFALYFDGKTGQITALNGSGRAPAALTLEALRAQGFTAMPARSAYAVTVPGAVRGWEDLLKRHGRMTLAETLADAIYYAREGFPVSPVFGAVWASPAMESLLRQCPYARDYLPDGKTPEVGQRVRLPDLARTLQAIADGGANAFYTGEIAASIVSTLQEYGGVMTLDDLETHRSTWHTPIQTTYRGIAVHECPPNGQGLVALQALNIAEGWMLRDMLWSDPVRLHLMIEAIRLAFADAHRYIADMAANAVPVEALLDKTYAAQRRRLIVPDRAMPSVPSGVPSPGSDTVYLTVVDDQRNACSFINSLYMGFGSGIVAKGTGVFLQNRGANFSFEPGHLNALMPGKRPYHTIIPGMATQSGALWASFGVMGGFMQPQGHVQVLSAMIDDDLNPQEALDRPRFYLMEGDPHGVIALEDGIPPATIARLAELGHTVRPVGGSDRALFGSGQIIRHDAESGVLFGGSDPRKDGLVAAY
ncbi:MAG TPA: gamma-glutamyltransferase [Aggregatilineaceae bacterium]|nr:gamma-glutamyltransferase [Aggregatilineaceae bacterium]